MGHIVSRWVGLSVYLNRSDNYLVAIQSNLWDYEFDESFTEEWLPRLLL